MRANAHSTGRLFAKCPSFSIIYCEDNSSPDFVNIIAYLHDVFGNAPNGSLTGWIIKLIKLHF